MRALGRRDGGGSSSGGRTERVVCVPGENGRGARASVAGPRAQRASPIGGRCGAPNDAARHWVGRAAFY